MDRESWWPQAQSVPDGHSRRVQHDCGPGRTLQITREGGNYRAWCFRCNEGDAYRVQPTMAEVTARLTALREGDATLGRGGVGACTLPVPAVHDVLAWPAPLRLWLYKTGLGGAEIGRLGAYYHPPSDRAVLPVFRPGTGHPAYWQARAIGRNPKYMGSPVGRSECVPTWGRAESIVVTEDILSAFKVGLVHEAACALGTSPTPALVRYLLEAGKPVLVWLDPDAAGRRGAAKLVRALRAYGLAPRNVVSARDPKLHTLEQIKEIICT